MNNKAQASALVFMIAIVVVILALAFVKPVNEATTNAMSNTTMTEVDAGEGVTGYAERTGMNCTDASITDFTKAGCWVTDIGQAYFIWGVIAFAGVVAAAKIFFE